MTEIWAVLQIAEYRRAKPSIMPFLRMWLTFVREKEVVSQVF